MAKKSSSSSSTTTTITSPKKDKDTSPKETKRKSKAEPAGVDIRSFFTAKKTDDSSNSLFDKKEENDNIKKSVNKTKKELSLSDSEEESDNKKRNSKSKSTVKIIESSSSEDENKKKPVVKKSSSSSSRKKTSSSTSPKKKIESTDINITSSSSEDDFSSEDQKKSSKKKVMESNTTKKKGNLRRLQKVEESGSESESEESDSEKKSTSKKRKVIPSSSSEDEKKKDKKIKLKSPSKSPSKSQTTTAPTIPLIPTRASCAVAEAAASSSQLKSPSKSQTITATSTTITPLSPSKSSKTPPKKVVIYSFEDSDEEVKGKEIEKENIKPTTTPDKLKSPSKSSSSSSSKSTPDKKPTGRLEFAPIISIASPSSSGTTNTVAKSKTPEKKIKDDYSSPFDDMEVDEKPSTSKSSKKDTPSKTPTKPIMNDDSIFEDDESFAFSPNKPSTTPTKSSATKKTPTKSSESMFDDNSIFADSPDKQPITTRRTTQQVNLETEPSNKKQDKFNQEMIFEDNDTPLNRAISKSIETRSQSKLHEHSMDVDKPKRQPIVKKDDEDATDEDDNDDQDTEDEGDLPIYKQPSNLSNVKPPSAPSTPSKKPQPATTTTTATPTKNPQAWRAFANGRPTPPNKGSKPRPHGKEGCLRNKSFLVSGILDSFERDEAHDIIKRWGGQVAKSAIKKLSYLVCGTDVGEKKLAGAKKVGAIIISEDDLLEMINKTAPKPVKQEVIKEEEDQVNTTTTTTTSSPPTNGNGFMKSSTLPRSGIQPSLPTRPGTLMPSLPTRPIANTSPLYKPMSSQSSSSSSSSSQSPPQIISMAGVKVPNSIANQAAGHEMLWVEKYKPKVIDDLVGNPGLFTELSKWLESWHSSSPRGEGKKNAVLLSGPPGIGKTSAALLICKQKGFEAIELNASDTRSKSEIERLLSGVSDNQNITKFFGNTKSEVTSNKKIRTAIILDEIDGSSGNSDRGGIAEIISLIKKSKMPFICLCNDYYSPKIKSLKNHCLDLKLRKPTVTQVVPRLLAIAKHESMKISNYMMEKVYTASHSDIRQCINTLQMMSRSKRDYNNDNISQGLEEKDFDLSPFTAAELILRDDNSNINKKLDYFFSDFSLIPLLIQENYLKTRPYMGGANSGAGGKKYTECELFSMAADAISDSDQFGRAIGKEMAWNLLPTYGVTSSIIPSGYIRGSPPMPLAFPSYLGKYSNASKQQRFVRELQLHMRSTGNTFANRDEIRLFYVPMLKHQLIAPLSQNGSDGIEDVINLMDEYGLTEDDRNNIIELSTWGKDDDPVKDITSAVKSSFTRKFRSTSHAIYDVSMLTSKVSAGSSMNIADGYEEVEGESKESKASIDDEDDEKEGDEDDDAFNNLVKPKKPSAKGSKKASAKSTATSKSKSKK